MDFSVSRSFQDLDLQKVGGGLHPSGPMIVDAPLDLDSVFVLRSSPTPFDRPRPLYNRKAFPWTPQQTTPKPKVGI